MRYGEQIRKIQINKVMIFNSGERIMEIKDEIAEINRVFHTKKMLKCDGEKV